MEKRRTRVEATMVLQMDLEMADRLRARHHDACQAIVDTLEVFLFSPEERTERDVSHIRHAAGGE